MSTQQNHPFALAQNRNFTFVTAASSITGKYLGENQFEFWVVKDLTNRLVAINPDQVITYFNA